MIRNNRQGLGSYHHQEFDSYRFSNFLAGGFPTTGRFTGRLTVAMQPWSFHVELFLPCSKSSALKVATIAEMYTELGKLFFNWNKQKLKIKTFPDTSSKAVFKYIWNQSQSFYGKCGEISTNRKDNQELDFIACTYFRRVWSVSIPADLRTCLPLSVDASP